MAEASPFGRGLINDFSTYTMSGRAKAASSSASSGSHSPTSLRVKTRPRHASRPVENLSKSYASRSYELRSAERHKIDVLDSLKGTERDSEEEDKLISDSSGISSPPKHNGSIDAAATVTLTAEKVEHLRRQGQKLPTPKEKSLHGPGPSSLRRSVSKRPVWARTTSGGLWYQKRSASSSQGSSTRSLRALFGKSEGDSQGKADILPLKFPIRVPVPIRPSLQKITVETPFGSNEDPATNRPSEASAHHRKPSFDARALFSAPLTRLKQVLKPEPKPPSPTPVDSGIPPTRQQDHSSAPRKDKTAATLARVTSTLETHQKLGKTKMRVRALTHKSTTMTGSSREDEARNNMKRTSPTQYALRRHSIGYGDDTSSILEMQMGSTPQNSEAEIATYRIKRTASAETEVFPIIDISIRGETSYLPSEARRIHTPPLPEKGYVGLRRGFFFDYNTPFKGEDSQGNETHLHEQSSNPVQEEHTSSRKDPPIHSTSPKLSPLKPSGRQYHSKATDWYDTQLADIDSRSDDIDEKNLAEITTAETRKRNECQAALVELKKEEYKAQLDYNIPEHLPSSLLCPRNPRYWRVVRNKGSQFRGCWMHGYGEYPPGEIPGVKPK